MNYCVVTGTVEGDIIQELNDNNTYITKFIIKNQYYSPIKNNKETTTIRCICYGSLARYCNNELYTGANVIVTGRVLNRHYFLNNTHIDRLYLGCNTVSKLDQLDYEE